MSLIPRIIATGLFVGYAPFAPGTVGSLVGLFLYWTVPKRDSVLSVLAIVFLLFVGVWAATEVEKEAGRDAPIIVIDEIVGMLITLIFLEKSFKWLAFGFVLFRFFDITKLFPARLSERLPNGWGVMMDDVVAGIYSALVLRLVYLFVK
ncbi:MAG: phosphatidylglycerophosphatase A [bacterium]